jgi:hypothetical protein
VCLKAARRLAPGRNESPQVGAAGGRDENFE